jgi:carboxylate-amine ligase
MEFKPSQPLTVGIELELQLVNKRNYDLTRASFDLMEIVKKKKISFDIKPEVTESMIEIASKPHGQILDLEIELNLINSELLSIANTLNIGICGGGTHPFQDWTERQIFPAKRYIDVSEIYGYLTKQFNVYGQHIHIGCENGDIAIKLIQYLSQFVPHFIALSSSSPYSQSQDTLFQSSRLTSISSFPLSGIIPDVYNWAEFKKYFQTMQNTGIVTSMKDFYWDIRPQPNYGTIEVRVCDTPITIHKACIIASYIYLLSNYFLRNQELLKDSKINRYTYSYNKFQAARYGFDGIIVRDVRGSNKISIADDIQNTLVLLKDFAFTTNTHSYYEEIIDIVKNKDSNSDQIRDILKKKKDFSSVVEWLCESWKSKTTHN